MLPSEPDESSGSDAVVLESMMPWRFWATAGFGMLIMAAYFVVQVVIVMAFFLAETQHNPEMKTNEFALKLESNGLLLAIATCATAAVCIPLIVLFAKLRRQL